MASVGSFDIDDIIDIVNRQMDFPSPVADAYCMPATKGVRLHVELRKHFEDYCRANLLDERAVIEAWLLQFLEASDAARQQAAARYGHWLAEQSKADRKPKRTRE